MLHVNMNNASAYLCITPYYYDFTGFKTMSTLQVFFPIYWREHFYVICFGMRTGVMDIIDNSKEMANELLNVKYGEVPYSLRHNFSHHLTMNGMAKPAVNLLRGRINVPRMSWRNSTNKDDCGVYVMRHMETYMGGGTKDWRCGLTAKKSTALQVLRAKYCKALLTSPTNHYSFENQLEAQKFFEKEKIGKKNDAEK